MMVAVRCSSKYLLTIGVIFNVLFIGLTQVLYISRYFKKSSSSSTSFSSSNKSKQIEKSRYIFIDNRDVADLGPIFKNDIKNVSGTPLRPSTKHNHINEIIESSLKNPARTKEQMRKIHELKEKIAKEINFNPDSQGRNKNGDPVEIPISPEKFCRPSSTALTLARGLLVVMVTSHVKDVRVRKEIRQTWADVPEVKSGQVRVVHLLGTITENGGTTQSLVEHEAEDYDDIVQGTFKDTYKNLTTKTLMGLQWASMQCGSSFKYFMKTDSDVYVNLPKIAEHLAGLKNWEKPHALGRKWVDVKPIRSPLQKWFVPEREYPGSTYPPYLGGSAYVMTSLAARMAYHEARSTRLVRLEDLYVGICFKKAGVQLSDEPRFSVSLKKIVSKPCDIHSLFTHHGVKYYDLQHLKVTQDHPDLCVNGTSAD